MPVLCSAAVCRSRHAILFYHFDRTGAIIFGLFALILLHLLVYLLICFAWYHSLSRYYYNKRTKQSLNLAAYSSADYLLLVDYPVCDYLGFPCCEMTAVPQWRETLLW
jgi:hypothetical protein